MSQENSAFTESSEEIEVKHTVKSVDDKHVSMETDQTPDNRTHIKVHLQKTNGHLFCHC